jgi:hypothetical protein
MSFKHLPTATTWQGKEGTNNELSQKCVLYNYVKLLISFDFISICVNGKQISCSFQMQVSCVQHRSAPKAYQAKNCVNHYQLSTAKY